MANEMGKLTKRQITYKYYRHITSRINAKWIKNNHYTVQMISGHSNFRSKLKQLSLSETENCKCGKEDTVEHVIYECTHLIEPRKRLELQTKIQKMPLPCRHEDLVSKEMYSHFSKFTNEVLKLRENDEKNQ